MMSVECSINKCCCMSEDAPGDSQVMARCTQHCSPPPPPPPPTCNSYGKVPNSYGPDAYCSLDKAVACTHHIHGELVREREILCTNIPNIRALWFKWANTHDKCVHDPM